MEFDRAEALEQAQHLFWRKGYDGTSLHDLLECMGLSKSSFYQTFGNKHQLFEQSIELYLSERTALMQAKLKASETAYDFILNMLKGVSDNSGFPDNRVGCLIMNTACEFAQNDPVIAKAVRDSIDAITKIFKQAVILGQQQGNISASKNPDELAEYLITNMGGLNVLFKAGSNADTIKRTAEIALSALK